MRVPKNFRLFHHAVAHGLDGKIDYTIVDEVKTRSVYSVCTVFGTTGNIWWSRPDTCWCIDIFRHGAYLSSLTGETIEDLMNNIRKFSLRKKTAFL